MIDLARVGIRFFFEPRQFAGDDDEVVRPKGEISLIIPLRRRVPHQAEA